MAALLVTRTESGLTVLSCQPTQYDDNRDRYQRDQ